MGLQMPKTINSKLLSQLATKEDLKAIELRMATKEDLAAVEQKMATKEDLAAVEQKMATKEDLKAVEQRTEQKFQEIGQEFGRVYTLLKTMDKRFADEQHRTLFLMERIETKVDAALEFGRIATSHTIDLQQHESRIQKLETDVKAIKSTISRK